MDKKLNWFVVADERMRKRFYYSKIIYMSNICKGEYDTTHIYLIYEHDCKYNLIKDMCGSLLHVHDFLTLQGAIKCADLFEFE